LTDLRLVNTGSLVNSPSVQAVDVTPAAGPNLTVNNSLYTYRLLADPSAATGNLLIVGAKVQYSFSGGGGPAPRKVTGRSLTDG
jgi:hypothetical protein